MICSACGNRVSFNAQKCPSCHRDTNPDQQALVLSVIVFGLGLCAGAFLANFLAGAAVGVALALAVLIVHRHLQRKS
jgi:hypothetical protein